MILKQYIADTLSEIIDSSSRNHTRVEFDINICPQWNYEKKEWDMVVVNDPEVSRIKFTIDI